MADLTFANLQAVSGVPANSFFLNASDQVCLNVEVFLGEDVDALTDEKVTETMLKLLQTARAAQLTYNDNGGVGRTAGNAINAFNALSWGTPTVLTDGTVVSTLSGSMQGRAVVSTADYTPPMV